MLECIKRCLAQLRKQELLFPVLNWAFLQITHSIAEEWIWLWSALLIGYFKRLKFFRINARQILQYLICSRFNEGIYLGLWVVQKDGYLNVPSRRLLTIKDLLIYEIRKVNRFWFVVACLFSSPEMFNTPFPKSIPLMKLRRWCEISMKKSKITKINI